VKNYIVAKNSTTKVSEEIIRTIKFYLIKLATDCQTSYLFTG
jgi:hypothetical protein